MFTHGSLVRSGPVWWRVQRSNIAWLTLLLATLTLVLTTASLSPLKDDVAWLLYVTRKWLGGQRLYEDLVEVNPPLIIWLYALPTAMASWLDMPSKLIANPFFAALMLGSAWWSAELLHGRADIFARRIPAVCAIATMLLVLPGVEFGQREHLMLAAILPYLVLYARELDGEREPRAGAIMAGALAGFGCALKPSYAGAFVLLELIGVLRGHRILRIAPIAAVVAVALYVGAVLVLLPAFLQSAVPLALALYGGTDTPFWQILLESRRLLFGQAVTVMLCWSTRDMLSQRSPFLRHLLLALTAFGVAATVVFVLQGKDWFYHRLPATGATVLALLLWVAIVATWRGFPWRRLLVAMPLAMLALLDFGVANYQRMQPWIESAVEPNLSTEVKLERLVKRENAKTYIAFSEWIALGFPVVNDTGVTWASRFDSMWALKGEIWRAGQDGGAPREWPIRRWVAKDFVTNCPDLAVVDARGGLNFVSVLIGADADFARAWSRYREIAAFDGLRVLRRGAEGCGPDVPVVPPHPVRKQLSWAEPTWPGQALP